MDVQRPLRTRILNHLAHSPELHGIGFPWNLSCSIREYGEAGAHALCYLWQAQMRHLKAHHDEHQTIVGAMTHFREEARHVETVIGLGNHGAMDRLEFIRSIAA